MTPMSKEDLDLWIENRPTGNVVTNKQLRIISELHARYFKHKFSVPCGCNKKLVISWIKDLDRIYEQ